MSHTKIGTDGKPLVRRPQWKQETPRDQLVAVLGAARGFADNIADGVYSTPEALAAAAARYDDLLEQAVELCDHVDGTWPSAEKKE